MLIRTKLYNFHTQAIPIARHLISKLGVTFFYHPVLSNKYHCRIIRSQTYRYVAACDLNIYTYNDIHRMKVAINVEVTKNS